MKRDYLWRISIATRLEAVEVISEFLTGLTGQSASSFHSRETGSTVVSVYLDSEELPERITRAKLQSGLLKIESFGLDTSPTKISIRKIKNEDWAESWKRHFHPIEFGDVFLIKPEWSHRKPRNGQATVILNPGLSFGTGHHATTHFCLEQIAKHRNRWDAPSFLDIGTGSGLLSIAAAKAGYERIVAFDNDPEAVRIAVENAEVNSVSDRIHFSETDVAKLSVKAKDRYHLVCANLIYDLLLAQSKRITKAVRPDGVLVLAGILQTQFEQVLEHYRSLGWRLASNKIEKEWQSGALVKTS